MSVSEEFRESFMGGGTFVSQDCMCGRIHFCNPEISNGDYEDGEYERLKKLQMENTVGLDLVSVVPMGEVFDEEAYTNERRKTILGNMIDDVETDYEKLEDMKKDFKNW